MSNYRRPWVPGATSFFTVVTARRRPVLTCPTSIRALRTAIRTTGDTWPFRIDAWVVLPDHMHTIWTLPPADPDAAKRWGRIKSLFTKTSGIAHVSRRRQYAGIWQPRFWEHVIRDEADFRAHMDYLHYNPVKHGFVQRVSDWPLSSFHRLARNGVYAPAWGEKEPKPPANSLGE